MTISYEWVFEEYDKAGDIVDPLFSDTLTEALSNEPENESHEVGIALVRSEGDNIDGLQVREYAYIRVGRLPVEFDDGYKIPQRFHREVAKI